MDDKGYVRITDFGIAKLHSNNNSSETSGTPGYMSPEVMKGLNHTLAVDYFALGVMGYEFMLGYVINYIIYYCIVSVLMLVKAERRLRIK